jgi:sigma-B regulation protein RsbU (phosphoserine phosphatase)
VTLPSIGGFQLTTRGAIALAAVVLDAILIATGSGGPLQVVITFVLVVWGAWRLIRLVFDRTRLIWQLRNRLIVTYVFIAVVPITLILALVFVAGFLLTGQVSAYLTGVAIDRQNAEIGKAARLLAREPAENRLITVQQLTASGLPPFEALVTGGSTFRYPADSTIALPPAGWADYTGIIRQDNRFYLMSLVTSGIGRALILRSFGPEDRANLVRGLGTLRLQLPTGRENPNPASRTPNGRSVAFSSEAGELPPAVNVFDLEVLWFPPVEIADWDRPNSQTVSRAVLATRPSAVLGIVSQTEIATSEDFMAAFYILAGLLGVAWLVSLYIGISMTRKITEAVSNLYAGTTRIGEGDFEHDIPVKGNDQLADLGRSFNKMAVQLEQFVVVTREKERLQSEIAIASEVQTRLFPLKPPSARTIEMLGICHAARMVSGDYYDYFTAADGELALALGDVAGKGISAALLMASIQSIMRTQLCDGNAAVTPSNTVARLNRLLYANTSPEKYATFFFGLYNDQTRRLTYTNAGHLPPLIINGDDYKFLEVTGSVVGAFPMLRYEEQTVPLGCGDLLVAYTDGITEPENAYGEDFGAERLADVVLRHRNCCPDEIVAKILEAVRNWDTSDEQADDMTLMIVRGLA